MAEETIQKKTGTERQAAFLVTALERASQQNGVLLNGTKKQTPRFFDKGLRVNPVNALIMAIGHRRLVYVKQDIDIFLGIGLVTGLVRLWKCLKSLTGDFVFRVFLVDILVVVGP